MKKLLSLLIAAVMSVSAFALYAVPAMAAESPTASEATGKGPTTQVNGTNNDKDVQYTPNPNNSSEITFEYTGDGVLQGWEDNLRDLGFVDGTDYTRTENPNGSLTITFISERSVNAFENGDVIVNAIVKFDTTTKGSSNGSSTSPNTGVVTTVIAGSVAAAGAGFAVMAATKKKDAE